MSELRWVFSRAQGEALQFQLRLGADEESEQHRFRPFLVEQDHEDLRWYLESYMDLPDAGSQVRARRIEASLDKWGRRLYKAAFDQSDAGALLAKLRTAKTPHLLTIASDDGEVLRQPWELLRDERGPLARQGITIRRQLGKASAATKPDVAPPLRVLIIVSRPDDTGFIDPRLTSRPMLEALAPLGGDVEVVFCEPPTPARMEELLSSAQRAGRPYHLVHFDGHGTFLPELGPGVLLFERAGEDTGPVPADPVGADRIGDLLARFDIPLVILEACRSGKVSEAGVFQSVAPRLLQAGVGSVLSMSHAVHVEAARILLARFYRELVSGATVGQALEEGRAALLAQPQRWLEPGPDGRRIALCDWFLPALYQRGEDPVLVPPRAAPAVAKAAERAFDVFLSHNHADKDRVERLAKRLRDQHRLRVWFDKWQARPGPLLDLCAEGIKASRYVLIACSKAALASDWVKAEHEMARAVDVRGSNVLPLVLEKVALPPELQALYWLDLSDPAGDEEKAAEIARFVGTAASAEPKGPARREPEGFPPPPAHLFHGRARELHQLERAFRSHRAVLLHAMGGMGKTSLSREAAYWWTRTGRFSDGACFVSFERGGGADMVVRALGTYLEGAAFEALPNDDQYRRAKELFQEKRVLLVWDNFESVLPAFQEGGAPLFAEEERGRIQALYRELTGDPAGEGRLLVTCRPEEAALPGAMRIELLGLARPDALSLLARVLQTVGTAFDDRRLSRDGLDDLLDSAGRPPALHRARGAAPQADDAAGDRDRLQRAAGTVQRRCERGAEPLSASVARVLDPEAEYAGAGDAALARAVPERRVRGNPARREPGRAGRMGKRPGGSWRPRRCFGSSERFSLSDRPYLRLHPTLPYAVSATARSGDEAVRSRFVAAYLAVTHAADEVFHGRNPRAGMKLVAREEANIRTAVNWALAAGEHRVATTLGDTLGSFCERAGRLRESRSLAAWLGAEVRKGGFSKAAANWERRIAEALFAQGQPREALERLEALIKRLERTIDFDPTSEIALTEDAVGRLLAGVGQAEAAIPRLERNAERWRGLIELWRRENGNIRGERIGLSVTLGNLANAYRRAGRLEKARTVAERALEIDRDLGDEHNVAASLARIATILMEEGSLRGGGRAVRGGERGRPARGGRKPLGNHSGESGHPRGELGDYNLAENLCQRAINLFQRTGDDGGVVRTFNLLGVAEQRQGRLPEARAWFERSREIASRLGDFGSVGVAAQDLGVAWQVEGEAALDRGDRTAAEGHLAEAEHWLREGLRLFVRLGNKPLEAAAWSQLAQLFLLRGQLDEAEEHVDRAREIHESLGIKEAYKDYGTLAGVARARGDERAAAEWQRKHDDLLAELQRRARARSLPPQRVQALQTIAEACAKACVEGSPLPSEAVEALTKVEQLPPPLDSLAPFLRDLAAGSLRPAPEGLPKPIADFLAQVRQEIEKAKGLSPLPYSE